MPSELPRDAHCPELDQHRIDGDERSDEFDERGNVFRFEAAAAAPKLCVFQFADLDNVSVFPNPGVEIVGANSTGVGPGVDR